MTLAAEHLCFECGLLKGRPACTICGPGAPGREPVPRGHELPPGTEMQNKYVLCRLLGGGGFANTYLAVNVELGFQRVAIKEHFPVQLAQRQPAGTSVVPRDKTRAAEYTYLLDKFIEEAKLHGSLPEHPNIVQVKDVYRQFGTGYLVMEFVDGNSLQELVEDGNKPLSDDAVLQILRAVLSGLSVLHDHGVVHRDIKPANICMTSDGRVKLVDFGAARSITGTRILTQVWTPGYAPLEQVSRVGNEGPFTDVYAVAATGYFLLTGKVPADATDRVGGTELEPLASLLKSPANPKLVSAIMKGLALKATERFPSARAFLEALGETGSSRAAHEPKPAPSRPLNDPRTRIRAVLPIVPVSSGDRAPPPPPPVNKYGAPPVSWVGSPLRTLREPKLSPPRATAPVTERLTATVRKIGGSSRLNATIAGALLVAAALGLASYRPKPELPLVGHWRAEIGSMNHFAGHNIDAEQRAFAKRAAEAGLCLEVREHTLELYGAGANIRAEYERSFSENGGLWLKLSEGGDLLWMEAFVEADALLLRQAKLDGAAVYVAFQRAGARSGDRE